MVVLLSILHVLLCLILVLIVLLQSGKGSDLASAFGGGASQTVFGSAGAAPFLNKMTTVVAVMFMMTSLTLALLASGTEESLVPTGAPVATDDAPAPVAGGEEGATDQPAPPAAESPAPGGDQTGPSDASSEAPAGAGAGTSPGDAGASPDVVPPAEPGSAPPE